MREITFSSAPMTLWQSVLGQRAAAGDAESILMLIVERTDLTMVEARALDMVEDVPPLIENLGVAINRAVALSNLGKGLTL